MPKNKLILPAKIGIVGYGIVGQAVAHGFSRPEIRDNYEILFYDKYRKSGPLAKVIKDSEYIFICLPTPMQDDERGIDLSIIKQSVKEIARYARGTDKIIIIKSTVVPGTTAALEKEYSDCQFCFNPEFLTEENYLTDFLNADRTVVGANNDLVSRRVVSLYQQRFPGLRIFQTDPTTAEMVKYAANTYLATKVIFANEVYDLCQSLGIKYEEMKKMMVADRRIYDSHLDVTTERGFGKKCFPKDIVALLGLGRQLAADLKLLETVWQKNKRIRKVRDWEEIPFAVSKKKK